MALLDLLRPRSAAPAGPTPADASGAAPALDDAPEALPGDAAEAPAMAPADEPAALPSAVPMPARGGTTSGRHALFTSYQTTVYGEPAHDAAYEHGHIDGTFGGTPEAFRAFIGDTEDVRFLDRRIAETTARRDETRHERAERMRVDTSLAAAPLRIEHLEKQAIIQNGKREAARDYLAASETLEEETREKSSLLNALIYTVATLAFLVGDVIVSKQVVATVLKLPDTPFLGLSERWWFAIGIALLAMVVKLAYERTVEKPYLREGNGPFRWVVLVAVALTLVTLGLLGWTRAYYTDSMSTSGMVSEADMTAQILRQLDGGAAAVAPAGDAAPAAPEHDTPLPIVIAFIATAVLFAITGGVCGGVAAQSWHIIYADRKPVIKRLEKARADDDEAERALLSARDARTTAAEALAADAERQKHLRAVADLDAEIDRLDGVLDALYDERRAARTSALRHSYESGFALADANRTHLDETPQATMRALTALVADIADAIDRGRVEPYAANALFDELRRTARAYLSNVLPADAFLAMLGDLRERFDALVAAGPLPSEPGYDGATAASGDGVGPRPAGPRPRPHLWMRDEMARLSSR